MVIPETFPEVLTRQQACDFLQVSLPWLDKWTRLGTIPVLKRDRVVRYRKTDLLNLWEEAKPDEAQP